MKLDGIKETEPVALSGLKLGGVYSQGNFAELKEFLLPKNDPKILYVGDNLIQDVFTPSFHLKLDSIAIVEELLVDGDTISKEYEILHSTVWGNYFHTSGKSTFWESVIRNHSKICVASIEHLAQNPIDYSYKLGYYPKNPNFDFCDKN